MGNNCASCNCNLQDEGKYELDNLNKDKKDSMRFFKNKE
jgi:hypothetical protein